MNLPLISKDILKVWCPKLCAFCIFSASFNWPGSSINWRNKGYSTWVQLGSVDRVQRVQLGWCLANMKCGNFVGTPLDQSILLGRVDSLQVASLPATISCFYHIVNSGFHIVSPHQWNIMNCQYLYATLAMVAMVVNHPSYPQESYETRRYQ